MNSRHRVVGFVGVLAFVLAACAGGNEEVITEQATAMNDLRRQVESLRAQVSGRDQEIQRLSAGASASKTLEKQVSALEERLRGMQDILLAKDEQLAKTEVQLEELKKSAAKPAVKKAKPEAAVKPPASPKAEASAKPEAPAKAESPAKPEPSVKAPAPAKPAPMKAEAPAKPEAPKADNPAKAAPPAAAKDTKDKGTP
jgi:outer membrane biosynthesis protein TonB